VRTATVDRAPGPSVRLKLTLSYAAVIMLVGAVLLAVVWLFLLRYVPENALISTPVPGPFPIRPTSYTPSRQEQPQHWRSCWCSVCSEGGSSPVACSPP
jgi:ABC-type glycerol-3-phosphate transport system permease component